VDNDADNGLLSEEIQTVHANSEQLEPPDLSHYEENRRKFPLDELAKYWGKYVAFSPDGKRIVASGDSLDAVLEQLQAAGVHFSQVVHAYIDPPDVSLI
jgi:glucose/arabinose dehydrogenase